jgi:hypothetical protein
VGVCFATGNVREIASKEEYYRPVGDDQKDTDTSFWIISNSSTNLANQNPEADPKDQRLIHGAQTCYSLHDQKHLR